MDDKLKQEVLIYIFKQLYGALPQDSYVLKGSFLLSNIMKDYERVPGDIDLCIADKSYLHDIRNVLDSVGEYLKQNGIIYYYYYEVKNYKGHYVRATYSSRKFTIFVDVVQPETNFKYSTLWETKFGKVNGQSVEKIFYDRVHTLYVKGIQSKFIKYFYDIKILLESFDIDLDILNLYDEVSYLHYRMNMYKSIVSGMIGSSTYDEFSKLISTIINTKRDAHGDLLWKHSK